MAAAESYAALVNAVNAQQDRIRSNRPPGDPWASLAARRRVIITVWSVPNPNQNAPLFQLVYGEAQRPLPGHRHAR